MKANQEIIVKIDVSDAIKKIKKLKEICKDIKIGISIIKNKKKWWQFWK